MEAQPWYQSQSHPVSGEVITFSLICLHLSFKNSLINPFFSFMQSDFPPLWDFLLADLNNLRLYHFYSKHFQRIFFFIQSSFSRQIHYTLFLCLLLSSFVCTSSFHLDWTTLETTDLNLYFFPPPFHPARCVHLMGSLNFNGLIP